MYSLEVVEYYKQFINPKDHEIFDQIFDIFITKENIINLDILAKYLNILKKNLKKTLVNSYIRDVDYFIESDPGWRAINREAIFITIDCAKRLCMRSNSNVGEIIRDYFILCEEISREYMMDGIEYKLDQTDGELFGAGPTNFDKRNCVYVIAIMGDQGPPI